MRQDADRNADADKQKKELAEAQNSAEQIVYAAEKSLKDYGDKVGEDIKKEVEVALQKLKAARGGTDVQAIKSASDALSTSMQKIGSAMAQQGQQTPPPSDQKPPEAPPRQ